MSVSAVLEGLAATRRRSSADTGTGSCRIRTATEADAGTLHLLVARYQAEGRLLPRRHDELAAHAGRFVVVEVDEEVVGGAELAPLGRDLAEVRSLVVSEEHRGRGLGGRLVEELVARAGREGYRRVCAFTHDPSLFARHGFSIVPHASLPEKIALDCRVCPKFGRCGQFALVRPARPGVTRHRPIATGLRGRRLPVLSEAR
jgi:amino-acid N-acetyltransferase